MSKLFYVVCDNVGIVSIEHDVYKSIKAVFSSKIEAEKLLQKYKDIDLFIKEVKIIVVRT